MLAPEGSIEGQLWFDGLPGFGGPRWLLYTPPGGDALRIPLGEIGALTAPLGDGSPGHDAHQH